MAVTDFTLPKIDQYAAKRVLAGRIMNNVVQNLIYVDGAGVTEQFSDDVMAAQIRILRQKMPTQTSRTLGAGTGDNDGHFNVLDAEQPITQEYDLPLLELFDRNVDIAQVLDDMIQIGTLNITIRTLEQRLAQLVNSYTMAVKIAAGLNYDFTSTNDELITFDATTEALTDKLATAHQKLDEGDPDNGLDVFPQEGRIVVTSTAGKYRLLTAEKTVYEIGSSRGVELLEVGSAGGLQKSPEVVDRGYYGQLYNTELYMASPQLFRLAEGYLGLDAGDLDGIVAIVSSHVATGRGIAFSRNIKIIDNPRGQGWRLQPLTRWGAKVWFPKGERLIVTSAFANPVISEATILSVAGTDNRAS